MGKGTLVRSEKSADNRFEFALWDNGEGEFIIEIKRYWTQMRGKVKGVSFTKFDKLTMTPAQFEHFKTWIKHFERKDK